MFHSPSPAFAKKKKKEFFLKSVWILFQSSGELKTELSGVYFKRYSHFVMSYVIHYIDCNCRVRTDLENSLKMTLVLENSWNSKKVQFVLELSLNIEKISLIITKSP